MSTTANPAPSTWVNSLTNGALVAGGVELLMRNVLHSEGLGTEVFGVQLEALLSGLFAMFFGGKLPAIAQGLKDLIAGMFDRGGTVAPADKAANSTGDEAREPTAEEAKVAAVIVGKRLKRVKPSRLESFRGIAADLGGEEYACVISKPDAPKPEAKPDVPAN